MKLHGNATNGNGTYRGNCMQWYNNPLYFLTNDHGNPWCFVGWVLLRTAVLSALSEFAEPKLKLKAPPNHTNTDEALAVSVAGKKFMLYSELKKIASDGFRTTLAVFTHNP